MIMKKVKCIVLIFIMLFISVVPVLADISILDFLKKGSINITLEEEVDNTKVIGAEITIYKVASAIEKDYNLDFLWDNRLESCQTEIEEGNITNEVLTCVMDSEVVSYNGVTDEEGMVSFTNLDLGLYLVTQTNQVEGYSKIYPFTVMIPQIQDNKWVYDVEATPKVDIIRLFDLIVEKVWNVSAGEVVPTSIEVELLKGEEVIDKITLNAENDWTYTWVQIEKSDEYSVREVNVPSGYVATYREEGNKFIVTNTKSLVQTGRSIFVTPILAVVGLLFIVVGVVLEKRKKYE